MLFSNILNATLHSFDTYCRIQWRPTFERHCRFVRPGIRAAIAKPLGVELFSAASASFVCLLRVSTYGIGCLYGVAQPAGSSVIVETSVTALLVFFPTRNQSATAAQFLADLNRFSEASSSGVHLYLQGVRSWQD
jgi:hypothetical protein